jgi:putative flavoprotein involved in K+ transport
VATGDHAERDQENIMRQLSDTLPDRGLGHADHHHEVVIVGGGQAGLAAGYFLAQQGTDFVILETAQEPAAAWRARWDSLTLFTPVGYSGLPGLPFPGDPGSYPGRDEVVAYLSKYARHFELPVELSSRVRALHQIDGRYLLELEDRSYRADQVVVATGPFQVPFVPPIAAGLAGEVVQLHSTAYRSRADIADGPALVVGGGNTGFQIAKELSGSLETHLSIGSRQKPLPQRLLGRDLFWYLDKTGLIRKSRDTRIGRRLEGGELLVGSSPREVRERYGVQLHPRAVEAAGRTVRFADGRSLEVASVIWATGFRHDHAWIEAPVFDDDGVVVHRRGVTAAPGLYFLGLTWQHTRGSALIGFVADDAAYIAQEINRYRVTAPGPRSGEPAGVA